MITCNGIDKLLLLQFLAWYINIIQGSWSLTASPIEQFLLKAAALGKGMGEVDYRMPCDSAAPSNKREPSNPTVVLEAETVLHAFQLLLLVEITDYINELTEVNL